MRQGARQSQDALFADGLQFRELRAQLLRDKMRIFPRHLQLTIRNELNKLLGKVTIAQDFVLPNIQTALLPKTESHKAKSK